MPTAFEMRLVEEQRQKIAFVQAERAARLWRLSVEAALKNRDKPLPTPTAPVEIEEVEREAFIAPPPIPDTNVPPCLERVCTTGLVHGVAKRRRRMRYKYY